MAGLTAVFQIGSIGDSIVSVPALLSLKELIPNCSEYLLISRFDTTLKAMPSHVFQMAWPPNAVANYKGPNRGLKEIRSVGSLLRQLRHYRPKHCVYMMPTARTVQQIKRDELFFRVGGVKDLIGFRPIAPEAAKAGSLPDVKRTEAYLKFKRIWNERADEKFEHYSTPPLLKPSARADLVASQWLATNRRKQGRLVAVCPYSNCTSKDIPDETLMRIIPKLESDFAAEVLILGGKKDFERAEMIVQSSNSVLNACGAFSLEESAAILQQCALALCADSGPMHLAAALGTPCVVVFSRMNKDLGQWFPLGKNHTVLYRNVTCAGCRALDCPTAGHPCMTGIGVVDILSAVNRQLTASSGSICTPEQETQLVAW